jgi:Ig-like domain CHU_C associated
VSITPPAPSIDHGQSVQLTANPSGGTGADTYAWYAGASCSGSVLATSQTYTTPALAANATYCVAVTDSAYVPDTANASATVTVTASSGTGTGSGAGAAPPNYVYPIVGVLVAVVAAALLLALLARRRRRVTFEAAGLPSGTSWSVTLREDTRTSPSSSIVFEAPKGEHPFSVKRVPGYTPAPASGTVNVGKDPSNVKVTFTRLPP